MSSSVSFKTKEIDFEGRRSILTQNENGACALLAIVNSLVLTVTPQSSPEIHDLVALVNSEVEIPLNSLLQSLAAIATSNQHIYQLSPQEVQTTLSYLPSLHKGLNINPTFDGGFSNSQELVIFKVFQLPLVHGWLVDPNDLEHRAVIKYNSYEAGQNVLVEAYDLNNKPVKDSIDEEIIQDSKQISHFFARTATQLTNYGLQFLKHNLYDNSIAVFFRNDHFGTIIKRDNDIYELVTDIGFLNKKEFVWESLLSINGANNSFFTGDFQPILEESVNPFIDDDASPQEQDDRVFALSLQQEEDQKAADALQKRYNKPAKPATTAAEIKEEQKRKKKEKKALKSKKDRKCTIM